MTGTVVKIRPTVERVAASEPVPEIVEAVLDEICDAVARGENVKLSSFGSFVVRDKGERIGRNPKTGVEVPIEPRRVMVFKPSNVMKARINGQTSESEDA